MSELFRVTSKSGFVWLYYPAEQADSEAVISSESVFLTVFDADGWSYNQNLRLVRKTEINDLVEANQNEVNFFQLVKNQGKLKYNKKTSDEYGISKYIHYSPKVSYEFEVMGDSIRIKGYVQDNNINFPIKFINVTVGNADVEKNPPILLIPRADNEDQLKSQKKFQFTFEYKTKLANFLNGERFVVPFLINTDKAEYARSFSLVNDDGVFVVKKAKK